MKSKRQSRNLKERKIMNKERKRNENGTKDHEKRKRMKINEKEGNLKEK